MADTLVAPWPPRPHPPLRGAVLGLGMIGRHHARLLQALAAGRLRRRRRPGGRPLRRRARPGAGLRLARRAARAGPPGLRHRRRARPRSTSTPSGELARAGVHVLVEKPLAATRAEARRSSTSCAEAGVRGAVGHVERFNPALLELRRRVRRASARSFLIATERVGPFPDRVRDVGVVKDLATHDLDLVRWLGGVAVARARRADPASHGPRARGPRPRRPDGSPPASRSTASSTGSRPRRSGARACSASAACSWPTRSPPT